MSLPDLDPVLQTSQPAREAPQESLERDRDGRLLQSSRNLARGADNLHRHYVRNAERRSILQQAVREPIAQASEAVTRSYRATIGKPLVQRMAHMALLVLAVSM